jgi:hypothetical protein
MHGQTSEDAARQRRFWVMMYAIGIPLATALGVGLGFLIL